MPRIAVHKVWSAGDGVHDGQVSVAARRSRSVLRFGLVEVAGAAVVGVAVGVLVRHASTSAPRTTSPAFGLTDSVHRAAVRSDPRARSCPAAGHEEETSVDARHERTGDV
jgi:hypothetical protein